MKIQALAMAGGLLLASSAHAINNMALTDSLYLGSFGAPAVYGDVFSVASIGAINHTLTFDITAPLYAGSGVADIPLSLQFGSFTLSIKDITGLSATIYDSGNNVYAAFTAAGNPDYLTLPLNSYFGIDSYTLKIGGASTGANGGTYTIAAVTVPVPEPETWAMLLAGLGIVGLRLRREAAAR